MTVLTVRGLSDETRHALKQRARKHGRSMEAEVRRILVEAVQVNKNWHQEVLAIGRRNGVTREDVDALMQAIQEADEPVAETGVFEE